jgi:hypothetical protein
MLTGKRFRFHRSVTGIQLVNGTATVVTIPTEGIIKVLSGPDANGKVPDKGIIYVVWEERTVAVFAVDIEARGTEIVFERENHRQSANV